MSAVLLLVPMSMLSDVLLEIVRNCDYLRADADDIIIRQGDDGDRCVAGLPSVCKEFNWC